MPSCVMRAAAAWLYPTSMLNRALKCVKQLVTRWSLRLGPPSSRQVLLDSDDPSNVLSFTIPVFIRFIRRCRRLSVLWVQLLDAKFPKLFEKEE